jgi:hypothetical protein
MNSALAPFLPCVLAFGTTWCVEAELMRAGPHRALVGSFRAGGFAQRDPEPQRIFTTEAQRHGGGEKSPFLSVPLCLCGENRFMESRQFLSELHTAHEPGRDCPVAARQGPPELAMGLVGWPSSRCDEVRGIRRFMGRSTATLLAAASPATTISKPAEAPPSTGLKVEEQRLLAKMAAEGTNSANLFALADFCHDEGVDGDKQAVPRAEAYLRILLESEPKHSRALALLGSVYTLKGRDAFWPTTQIRLVKEGNTYMDRAVTLAPEDVPTRVIRALNNAHMPDFLGRTQVVREDLDWLWLKIQAGGAPISTSAKQQLALHWGRILKRQHKADEASQVFRAGRAFSPDSNFAAELTTELEKLR